MAKTPGVIFPSFYSSKNDLKKDLKRRDTESGFSPFNLDSFIHSSINENEVDSFLEHHGIKGMKWGITHDPLQSLKSGINNLLNDHSDKPLTSQEKATLEANIKKHDAKFDKSEDDGGWRPTGKQVAITAAGAVFAGALIYGAVHHANTQKLLKEVIPLEEYTKLVKPAETPDWLKSLSGTKMKVSDYQGLVANAQSRAWSGGHHVTLESFKQAPITYNKGHEFFRLSRDAEKSFGQATYSIGSKEDLNRYQALFNAKHLISFKAKESVTVPDLYTRLEHMRRAMVNTGYNNLSAEKVLEAYNDRCGGGWKDPLSTNFFHELGKNGFDAIIDDMDAGVWGENPLVFFNSDAVTEKIDGVPNAVNEVLELTNRR